MDGTTALSVDALEAVTFTSEAVFSFASCSFFLAKVRKLEEMSFAIFCDTRLVP